MSTQGGRSVRIGPVSMFTLIAIICLSVLAVLAVTTANASYNMAQLQADSTKQQYVAEDAAQRFVAAIDQQSRSTAGAAETRAAAVSSSLDATLMDLQQELGGAVAIDAKVTGTKVQAQFTCSNGRALEISLTILSDGNYQIEKWNMTATKNNAQSESLWSGM